MVLLRHDKLFESAKNYRSSTEAIGSRDLFKEASKRLQHGTEAASHTATGGYFHQATSSTAEVKVGEGMQQQQQQQVQWNHEET